MNYFNHTLERIFYDLIWSKFYSLYLKDYLELSRSIETSKLYGNLLIHMKLYF